LNKYVVVYYNRMVNETQTFKVMAKNEYRAGRLFYKMYNRKATHIEYITSSDEHYWTEEEVLKHLEKKKERRNK
jgi:hypothetical protein